MGRTCEQALLVVHRAGLVRGRNRLVQQEIRRKATATLAERDWHPEVGGGRAGSSVRQGIALVDKADMPRAMASCSVRRAGIQSTTSRPSRASFHRGRIRMRRGPSIAGLADEG